ncbi:MAG: YggS family pyridoxal phosphate-dependent enzyme [Limnochordia bacterium]|jgi:pyridoxal phosphate enzyme (YggS family)
MKTIKENIARIRRAMVEAAVRANRDPEEITLIGVSKTVDVEGIQKAIDAGLTHIGENRVQEARDKFPHIDQPVQRHLIGHLQRNKVKYCFDLFDMIQSVDSYPLAEEINKQALRREQTMDILVQVNIGDEASKFGLEPGDVPQFVEKIYDMEGINFCGLMAIPPYSPEPEDVRPYFREMYRLWADLRERYPGCTQLSMGMSGDYPVAIEEGATKVRVGQAIFGARDY